MSSRLVAVVTLLCAGIASASPTPVPSWTQLPTGNGFGFTVFDAGAKKVTTFLERPYKYLSPGATQQSIGVYRRDLAYDMYMGALVQGTGAAWMPEVAQTNVGYVNQDGVIHTVGAVGTVSIESFYFEPFGLQQNALVMMARATNTGAGPVTLDLFALPNMQMGSGDPDSPSNTGETITTTGALSYESGNLGEPGGSMVYLPIGSVAKADCNEGYTAVQSGNELPNDTRNCTGNDKTLIFQSSPITLQPGASQSFGLIVAFSSTISGAASVGTAITSWLGTRTADQVLADAQSEWSSWRKPPPAGLSDDETRVYRQAEATLRMAQVLEPYGNGLTNHGMILASLPPGIWHVGWVRDATYAIVALAQMGHLDEAKAALTFFLSARADQYKTYTNGDYRISVCRYFGDGIEESDWNADGPNIEFDGWGLFLWALRQTLDNAGERSLLDSTLPTGEKFIDVVRSGVQGAIKDNLESSGLMLPDTSIWESHWNNRKHYTYTSMAAARGLCDLAAIEDAGGNGAAASTLRLQSTQLRAALKANDVDATGLLGGSQEGIAHGTYHDGAALEAFNWELYDATDPLYDKTLTGLDGKLSTGSSGWMRNDDNASSYDSNEWIFVDMRAAEAFRRRGDSARADQIIAWVTAQARANYDLLPELYNTFASQGTMWAYTGSIPMVGFGAGAYVLTLRQRAGQAEAHDCGPVATDMGPPNENGDAGSSMHTSGGCGCSVGRRRLPCPALALMIVAVLLTAVGLRRLRRPSDP